LENIDELDELYSLLKSIKNNYGETPKITANVMVSNPDFEATIESNFERLNLVPIDRTNSGIVNKWKEGVSDRIFFPQYHGRLHYNMDSYLLSLQNNNEARELFKNKINGPIEHFIGNESEYYSEYFNYRTCTEPNRLYNWIKEGLSEFNRIFGYNSQSTIAPNYVLSENGMKALAENDIQFLQGGNKIFCKKRNTEEFYLNYSMGTKLRSGMTSIARTIKFEPCRDKENWNAQYCITSSAELIKKNIPVVIATHRFNYVTSHARESRKQLSLLLKELVNYDDVRFLTTIELGEAIRNNGNYTDSFSGLKKKITLLDSPLKKVCRKWVS
jgi:hypothetical protein